MPVSERQPLLKNGPSSRQVVDDDIKSVQADSMDIVQRSGPLDITTACRHRILVGIWLAQFLSALNLTLVPTMIPSISSEFNKSNEASWVGTSYLLATCTFTPLYGRLSNVMGRSGANQSAIIFAAIGILSCGLSNSMLMLIISRFISGLGGGGIFTTSAIITSDMYNMRTRGFIQSIGGIFYGLGMGLGGPIGGVITDWLGWRWAFLIQVPFFALSYCVTTTNLLYEIPGAGKSAKDILKRIDYGGILTLFGAVASVLLFLSAKFNESRAWSDSSVWMPLSFALISTMLFLIMEIFVAVEPILPLFLLTQKVPVLIGCSNALVAVCNLSVTYYLPMWFQTVMLSSASAAGLHLLPNSICISTGSVFAGWMMRRTGKYKLLNLIFGCWPFFAAVLLTRLSEHSGLAHTWLTIMPLGFGNAVVLQTMYIALVSNLPEEHMAIGTGFVQLLRGLGQVGGLATASAVFQSRLETELRSRLQEGDTEEIIQRIRHSIRVVGTLPPNLQRIARDSYAGSIQCVFLLAACASLLAFLARLPIPDRHLVDSKTDARRDCEVNDDSSFVSSCSLLEEARDEDGKVVRSSRV